MFLTALNLSHDFLSAIFGILRKFRIDIGIFFSKHIFFEMKKNLEKKCFEKKWDFFCKNRVWDFFQLKSHLKSIFQKSILNDFSIEIFDFRKFSVFFFFSLIFFIEKSFRDFFCSFYNYFIISHAQPMQVASRNSL